MEVKIGVHLKLQLTPTDWRPTVFPYVSVNSSGVVSLTYYQENSSGYVDVYAAESFNQGQSFDGLDTRITSTSSNPSYASHPLDYMGRPRYQRQYLRGVDRFQVTNYAQVYSSVIRAVYNSGGAISQTYTIPQGETMAFQQGVTADFGSGAGLVVNEHCLLMEPLPHL